MRLTHASFSITSLLMSDPDREWYGLQLRQATTMASGVLYPILARMRDAGWLTERWEELDHYAGRPLRRYFRLTPAGREACEAMLDRASRDRRFVGGN